MPRQSCCSASPPCSRCPGSRYATGALAFACARLRDADRASKKRAASGTPGCSPSAAPCKARRTSSATANSSLPTRWSAGRSGPARCRGLPGRGLGDEDVRREGGPRVRPLRARRDQGEPDGSLRVRSLVQIATSLAESFLADFHSARPGLTAKVLGALPVVFPEGNFPPRTKSSLRWLPSPRHGSKSSISHAAMDFSSRACRAIPGLVSRCAAST